MAGVQLRSAESTLETKATGNIFTATVKCYTRVDCESSSKKTGYVLIFAHGVGYHKEHWEPTIQHLFSLDRDQTVCEAWAVDCQNHGDSAVMNEKILFERPGIIDIWDYSDALAMLLRDRIKEDKGNNKYVLVGHSAGATGCVLATCFFNPAWKIPLETLILVEPAVFPKHILAKDAPAFAQVLKMAPLRRDRWPDRTSAKEWFAKRVPFNTWDPRILDIYVEHGLRDLPTLIYPNEKGVTLKATKRDETRGFQVGLKSFDALWRLNMICETLPIHVIFGEVDDLFSQEMKYSIVDTEQGRTFASVHRIEGCGHMVVQEAPERLAHALWNIVKESTLPTPRL